MERITASDFKYVRKFRVVPEYDAALFAAELDGQANNRKVSPNRYLRDSYKNFRAWELALIAYNEIVNHEHTKQERATIFFGKLKQYKSFLNTREKERAMRISFTALNKWDKGDKEGCISYLMGEEQFTSPAMENGKVFHSKMAEWLVKNKQILGADKFPQKKALFDYKFSKESASKYAQSMQLPYYAWLLEMCFPKGKRFPEMLAEYKMVVNLNGFEFVGIADACFGRPSKAYYLMYHPDSEQIRVTDAGMIHLNQTSLEEAEEWALRVAREIKEEVATRGIVIPKKVDFDADILYNED